MAETVKLPVLGPTDRRWVWAGTALIAGIVGYAYWTRSREAPAAEQLPEDIPQDREPPPTVVGSEEFDTAEVRAIINTNAEWYTAAVDYLSTTGGNDFTFTTVTLGKFLARRQLTENEANLVQAAKGAVGEPPQGGPWPIIRATPTTPTTGPARRIGWVAREPLNADIRFSIFAGRYAQFWGGSQTKAMSEFKRNNPTRLAGISANSMLKKGWVIRVPVYR